LFGQIAADGADGPRQLLGAVQLSVGQYAAANFVVGSAQGQQNAAVRARLGADLIAWEDGSEFLLNEVHGDS